METISLLGRIDHARSVMMNLELSADQYDALDTLLADAASELQELDELRKIEVAAEGLALAIDGWYTASRAAELDPDQRVAFAAAAYQLGMALSSYKAIALPGGITNDISTNHDDLAREGR